MLAKNYLGIVGLLVVAVLYALFVSGCRLGPRSDENAAHVRIINAVPDVGGLTIFVDDQRVWKRLQFRSSTAYQSINDGTYPVRMDSDAYGTALMSRSLSFVKRHNYTVLAFGQAGNEGGKPRMLVWEDQAGEQGDLEQAEVRLVNASPGVPPVDLVVNNIVGLKAIAYGRRSPALPLAGGSYDFKIVAADTPDALGEPVRLRLEQGHAYTLIAMGQTADTLSLEAYPDTR